MALQEIKERERVRQEAEKRDMEKNLHAMRRA
jgi:hypothetical protein